HFGAAPATPETHPGHLVGRGRCGQETGGQALPPQRELIPGSDLWPRFVRNQSDRFAARFSLVEVTQSPSLLLEGMV
ncbi:phosphoribosylformylglycinamidine synthase subunit PurQ, partial [Mycobacterium tuberculosis]|nr:phosphoribosylformylglycinamidine synthase subunit PurQ [Mycobacterium tuberculosis]